MWKWIKVPKGIALLAFILPWMTVSCSGTKLISATGFGLAFGRFTNEMRLDRAASAPGDGEMNPWLILALVAIAIGLIVSLRPRGKANALILAGASAAGVALIWLGTMRYSKSALLAEAAKQGRRRIGEFSTDMDRTAAAMIRVDWHFGFYLALLALLAAGVMAWLSYSGRDAEVARATGAPEPPAICPTCGRSSPAGTRFCPEDGTALS